MNLNKLMKQAQKMQEQMAKTQAELEEKTIEVQAGGGKVKVKGVGCNGRKKGNRKGIISSTS